MSSGSSPRCLSTRARINQRSVSTGERVSTIRPILLTLTFTTARISGNRKESQGFASNRFKRGDRYYSSNRHIRSCGGSSIQISHRSSNLWMCERPESWRIQSKPIHWPPSVDTVVDQLDQLRAVLSIQGQLELQAIPLLATSR